MNQIAFLSPIVATLLYTTGYLVFRGLPELAFPPELGGVLFIAIFTPVIAFGCGAMQREKVRGEKIWEKLAHFCLYAGMFLAVAAAWSASALLRIPKESPSRDPMLWVTVGGLILVVVCFGVFVLCAYLSLRAERKGQ